MIVFVAGRQQGKTIAVVRWLLEDPQRRALLVATQDRKNEIMRMLYQLAYMRDRRYWEQRIIVGSPDFLEGYAPVEVGIDDLDTLLEQIFRLRVEFVTINATLIHPEPYRPEGFIDGECWPEDSKEIEPRPTLGA